MVSDAWDQGMIAAQTINDISMSLPDALPFTKAEYSFQYAPGIGTFRFSRSFRS